MRTLKRRGANVLVVGTAGSDAACSRLLGDSEARRRRLFVLGDGAGRDPEACADLGGRDPERVGVVEVPTGGTRSTAASGAVEDGGPVGPSDRFDSDAPIEPVGPAASGSDDSVPWMRAGESDEPWRSRTAPCDLSAAARHVHVHLSRFEATGPEPSEIRLCLDPLDEFAAVTDGPAFRRFVEVVTNRLRTARGMGHYHLSAGADELIEDVRPMFDATVETRTVDAGDGVEAHQRWTLHADGLTTDWLPL